MRSVAHYELQRRVGEGGMGVVYAARDRRLEREVAIKILHASHGAAERERLWREAKASAGLDHPGVCRVYDVGEHDGEIYLAMELLRGESLEERLQRGSLPLAEALSISRDVLAALDAVHVRGLVHRDLKPSNVFLTEYGPKLVDFGLALPMSDSLGVEGRLTAAGTVVGTPRYMAPEQWEDSTVGAAADLFAWGAVLFEMVSGRPAFEGASALSVLRSVATDQPPVLTGGPAAAAVDRIVHRALAKRPAERWATASAMASEVERILVGIDAASSQELEVRAIARLVVLPFRLLRPDPEIEFLAWGLADAVTASLAGLESLVVRSSRLAAEWSGSVPDLSQLARELDVDAVLFGTLLRSGPRVRISTQLVEAPSGAMLCSNTSEASMTDVFQVQDELGMKVVESLKVPLSARERSALRRDSPRSARAYELYLRANHGLSMAAAESMETARAMYRESLAEDPGFAPAWARLGRVCRILAKYGHGDSLELRREAREAFERALELNPELPIAHNYYTYFEVEELSSPISAMQRLLERAEARPADPDLYAGLVVACRFCGLLPASIAAWERARRFDRNVRSSVNYTFWMLGEYDRALELDEDDGCYTTQFTLAILGRIEELEDLNRRVGDKTSGFQRSIWRMWLAAARGDRESALDAIGGMPESDFPDAEGLYHIAQVLARVGEHERAFALLERIVDGFCCDDAMRRDPWFETLRPDPRFTRLVDRAEELRRRAELAFDASGGRRLLVMDRPPTVAITGLQRTDG